MSALTRLRESLPRRGRPIPKKTLGVIVVLAVTLWGIASFSTARIGSFLTPGDTIHAEFSREYKTRDFQDKIKLAGVEVGEITSVEPTGRGTTMVTMRVDHGIRQELGDSPSAALRPTLVVGGIYDIALTPGGVGNEFPDDGTIPVARTTVPVELDRVLTAVDPAAQRGIQTSVRELDGTLRQGGEPAVKGLVRTAPGVLAPAGGVLQAANGTRPGTDLPQLVDGLERTAAVLNNRKGQLGSILDSLNRTSAALAASSKPLSESIHTAPDRLRVARAGLVDLQPTLDDLQETAPEFRPSAQSLDKTLGALDPVIARARPVVSNLNDVLDDARPLVQKLEPTTDRADKVLDDVRGPVLDRVNGPIMDTLNTPWRGTGVYANGGDGQPFYKETGYLAAIGADVFKFHDQNGGMARLMAGVGANSAVGGNGSVLSLEQYLEGFGLQQPAGPQEPGGRQAQGGVPGVQLPTGLTGRPNG
jgi:phospholipid/cholesterol/gamma-HCH transport system substrate-binding protein